MRGDRRPRRPAHGGPDRPRPTVAVAASGNRLAGYLAALSAGVWFDFYFTEPYQRLTIGDRSDVETFVLLLAVGIAVTELAVWVVGRRPSPTARPGTWQAFKPPPTPARRVDRPRT
ncbi:DUF4118 domain-containing protein [Actinoplanes sp. NPDC049118]|uniref:DUF4118 domain-containing protein n=1 Tax=Actinoplanes sp. NPDC049118 TaxID=3155769 RepID=UPI0033EAEBB7